jgi:hypothetical protein
VPKVNLKLTLERVIAIIIAQAMLPPTIMHPTLLVVVNEALINNIEVEH